ncbi:uncharacterized protein LOC132256481 [Phlebotomus argentipes]|uniref:uncharacterized protein LOC132256481 n=1 Tax=Phlebotomus argentipes TaxID=94469 RepID=UPI0028932D05|nr:uncharacterized protein LOC132256481 [Phlebotomus argentipes]XP_059608901.1 uncharacterized protein LOC132256481 [Phlebotomus argentipes]XP_059608902.1 uncharacterized protein LOC132256481 [Phlebotomus argentipes]XP_059608903.1 uncharacterized protein LOC132256481 [Phlebotomus argentipes]
MGKKGTKKKTKWHSLPMEDTASTPQSAVTHGLHRDQTLAGKPFSVWRLPPTKSSSVSSLMSNETNADGSHKAQAEISSNTPANGHCNNSDHLSRAPNHRRRNYQANSYHGAGRHVGHRASYFANNSKSAYSKPTFNEDEYTRITTPRQDVLFKKGYLTRPKNNMSSIATNDSIATPSSSGTVSVNSMDDSATPSTQSVSPEHCNSVSEASEGEYPSIVYPGFLDQNGILYVNPFPTFDPYVNGQIMMMPYAVNNMGSMDLYSAPMTPYDAPCSSVDSQITSPDTASLHNEEIGAEAPQVADDSNDAAATAAAAAAEGEDGARGSHLNPDSINFYPQLLPPFPQPPNAFFYTPYLIDSPPMMPICDDPCDQVQDERMKRDGVDENLSGLTSEDEEETYNEGKVADHQIPPESQTDIEDHQEIHKTLRIPQESVVKSTLNVEVKEFHPRKYSSINQCEDDKKEIETSENAKDKKIGKKESANKKRQQNQPYSQLVNNRKLLQEATKSIQEQNIDLLKNNSAAHANSAAAGETKWQTIVKPRGRKGRSVAIEDEEGDEDCPGDLEKTDGQDEVENTVKSSDTPVQLSPMHGKSSNKKSSKGKKKLVSKKNKKQRNCAGFEVIEPDFGRIVHNKKTEITHLIENEQEEDSDVDEIGANVNEKDSEVLEDNVIDVCNDEECRELESELLHIESILMLKEEEEEEIEESGDCEILCDAMAISAECEEVAEDAHSQICDDDEKTEENPCEVAIEYSGGEILCDDHHTESAEDGALEESQEAEGAGEEEVQEDCGAEKVSLLDIVTQWLDEKYRTNCTDDLFRLPDNPAVLQRLYETTLGDMGSRSSSSESDSEEDTCLFDLSAQSPGQLKNQVSLSEDDSIDTDSDYQSDGQAKNKRMTSISSSESLSLGQQSRAGEDSQPKEKVTEELIKGSPTLTVTSINSLNCSNSAISDSTHDTTLHDKPYTKSPVLCILM